MDPHRESDGVRAVRKGIEIGLPVLGVALVLVAVVFFVSLYVQIAIVLLGLVLIEAGIWNLASPMLPSERKYLALRAEVDGFIGLVRKLNSATLALAGDPTSHNRAQVLEIRDRMLESVREMERLAGKTDEELASARKVEGASTSV